jgi:hypothetical protein
MGLTAEEKRKIYEEERARIEAQSDIANSPHGKEQDHRASRVGLWILLIALLVVWRLYGPLVSVVMGLTGVSLWAIWDKAPWARSRKWKATAIVTAVPLLILTGNKIYLEINESRFNSALSSFERHLRAETLDQARKAFVAAERINPASPAVATARSRLESATRRVAQYRQGRSLLAQQKWEEAIVVLRPIKGYRDVSSLLLQAKYEAAKTAVAQGEWEKARNHLAGLPPGFREVPSLRTKISSGLTLLYGKYLVEAERALADGYRPARDPARTQWGRVADAKEALGRIDVSFLTPLQTKRYYRLKAETERREGAIAEVADRLTKRYLREQFSQEVERIFLDKGMDVRVILEGRDKTVIRLKWVLWSRPLVYQWGKNAELFGKFRQLGFERIIFDTGFGQRWWYDL